MFTSTEELLTKDSFKPLCHSLLRRSAALQLASHQPLYDLLIPFYHGDINAPYDGSKAGAILVQIKNRKTKTSPSSVLSRPFHDPENPPHSKSRRIGNNTIGDMIVDAPGAKLLFVLLDFGVEQSDVQVSCSRGSGMRPKIWDVHATAHERDPFGCLEKMEMGSAARDFYDELMRVPNEGDVAYTHNADLLANVWYHDKYDWTKGETHAGDDG